MVMMTVMMTVMMEGMEMEGLEMVFLDDAKVWREIPEPMSSEVFFVISVELPVAFSIIEVIPNLSTPFLMPSKNVFEPKPSICGYIEAKSSKS